MNREELKKYLPHRDAMLLLQDVVAEERDGGKVAVSKIKINGDEWFLQGHFPNEPVVPGVILCEMMAQSCCLLCDTNDGLPFFAGIKNAKFRLKVKPGDTLVTECEILRSLNGLYLAKGTGTVLGKTAVEAEFSFVCRSEE